MATDDERPPARGAVLSTQKSSGAFDYQKAVEALRLEAPTRPMAVRRKFLLHVIARAADAQGRCTHVGLADLAVAVLHDESTVRADLDALQDAGLIERHRRNTQDGRAHNLYILKVPMPNGNPWTPDGESANGNAWTPDGPNGNLDKPNGDLDGSPTGIQPPANGNAWTPDDHHVDHPDDHLFDHQARASARGEERKENQHGPSPWQEGPQDGSGKDTQHASPLTSPNGNPRIPTGHDSLSSVEPWEDYSTDKVPDILEGIDIYIEEGHDDLADFLVHIWAYETAHKKRVRIITKLEEAAAKIAGDAATAPRPPGVGDDEFNSTVEWFRYDPPERVQRSFRNSDASEWGFIFDGPKLIAWPDWYEGHKLDGATA